MKTVKMEVEFTFNEKLLTKRHAVRNFLKDLFGRRDLCLTDEVEELGTIKVVSVFLPSGDKNRQWSQLALDLNN